MSGAYGNGFQVTTSQWLKGTQLPAAFHRKPGASTHVAHVASTHVYSSRRQLDVPRDMDIIRMQRCLVFSELLTFPCCV
jgi:hypothetical protein